jgi:hypothetical protein
MVSGKFPKPFLTDIFPKPYENSGGIGRYPSKDNNK